MQSTSMEMEAAAAALPDDLLAVVLGRLPARSLAASRGVCKAWRDLIDDRRFLLPYSVGGLFINYRDYRRTHFLSRPTPTSSSPDHHHGRRRIDGKFDFIERKSHHDVEVADHCNGLVLLLNKGANVLHICNPATRWSACLPPCPVDAAYAHHSAFLMFDPFVSPEYKVLLSPAELENDDDRCGQMKWPPAVWTAWYEFSSSTGRWQEKVFVWDGEAAGMVVDLLLYKNKNKNNWGFHVEPPWRYAVYWKGALYVHCHGGFVSRMSLVDGKYRVIKSPVHLAECKNDGVESFLGRSEKGLYIATIATDTLPKPKLRVWTLSESGGQIQWVPKDQRNLKINTYSWWMENNKFDDQKYWILDHDGGRKNQDTSLVQLPDVCWNSDDDNIVDVSDDEEDVLPSIKFLGFHPYKEVIFLCSHGYVVAFHLNSPRVQYLGTVHLTGTNSRGIRKSFVYTPCFIGGY